PLRPGVDEGAGAHEQGERRRHGQRAAGGAAVAGGARRAGLLVRRLWRRSGAAEARTPIAAADLALRCAEGRDRAVRADVHARLRFAVRRAALLQRLWSAA